MRRKIAFVIPRSIWSSKDHLPSLGVAYACAAIAKHGYEPVVLDCQLSGYSPIEAAQRIAECRPDALGITATSHSRFEAAAIAREIRLRGPVFLFCGGVHFGLTGPDALAHIAELDVVVKGEGDETLPELLDAYFNDRDFAGVRGVVYRTRDGRVAETEKRGLVRNLDALPDPAWSVFDLPAYNASLQGANVDTSEPAIGIMSSRGCPHGCCFCANEAFWGRRFRRLSPERFVDQIESLYRWHDFRCFDFWDDTFTEGAGHARQVCNLILQRGLDINFYIRSRVDTVDREFLGLLRDAGCVAIGFGLESGSQTVLDRIPKHITVSQARDTIKLSLDMGFTVKAVFMTSLPGETLDDVVLTMQLVDELKAYGGARIHTGYGVPTTIYPGTQVEALAKKLGMLPSTFSWNSPYESAEAAGFGRDPHLPCFENISPTLEEINAFREQRRDLWRTH